MNVQDAENKPVESHFTVFVYPFFHRFEEIADAVKKSVLHGRWSPWFCRLPNFGAIEEAFDDSYFFLPFARRLLFPEFADIPNTPDGRSVLEELLASCEQSSVPLQDSLSLHLTLQKQELDRIKEFDISLTRKSYSAQGKIEWVDLFLFAQKIGFLTIKIKLTKHVPAIADLFNFNSYFRAVIPPSPDVEMAQLSMSGRNEIDSTRKLVEYLIDGFVDASGKDYVASSEGQVYGERFNTYSYACIDTVSDAETFHRPNPPFETVLDRILYEYATSAPWGSSVTTNGKLVPSKRCVTERFSKYELSLWQIWNGMFLRDAAVFLAHIPNKFTVEALRHNIENDYFNLYIFSLYQKFRLYRFGEELVREKDNPRKTLRSTRSLLDRFVEFRNRFWSSEVTKKPQGHEVYRKYRLGLGTEELFERIHNEINDLNLYYETKIGRWIKNLLSVITFVVTPIVLVNGFFHAKMFTLDSCEVHLNWVLLLLSLLGVGGLYLIIFISYLLWQRLMSK